METDTFQRTTPRVPFDAIAAVVQEKANGFFRHLPREVREERVQEGEYADVEEQRHVARVERDGRTVTGRRPPACSPGYGLVGAHTVNR